MGRCMSGTPSWALTEPSTNSTIECTIDWGCTTISMAAGGQSKSHRASIISKPLFIIDAESTVTLAPIFQLGWLRASATVTFPSCSFESLRKGPPLAVRRILRASERRSP